MRKICLVLIVLLMCIGTPVLAVQTEEIAFPDFLVRIPLAEYDERSWVTPPPFNYPPGTPTAYYVVGERRETDLPMLIDGGRTMLPLRLVGEACGAEVSWDNSKKQATIQLDGQNAFVRLGCTELLVDGKKLDMGVAPTVRGGVVYLPLRAIGEALGKEVFYCNRLQQAFVMVCDKEKADYESRQNFNQLMEQTYFSGYGDIWDVGRQRRVTVSDNDVYTDGSGLFEQAFVGDCWLECAPEMEEELGCKLLSLTMPTGGAYYIIGLYAEDMELAEYSWEELCRMDYELTDARILWDAPSYYQFSDDGFVYDHYWYAVESWRDVDGTDHCRLFRIDLRTSADEYFVPEYLGVENYHYGYADYAGADTTPRYIVTEDALYAHGYRDAVTKAKYPEGWYKIFWDGSGHESVAVPPPESEWLDVVA